MKTMMTSMTSATVGGTLQARITDLIVDWIEQRYSQNEAKTSIIVVTGSKFMQQRTMWTTRRNMNLCMNSCFAIVLHIVLWCINLLPVTTMMLVLASFLMLRPAHCCSIQSTMRSVARMRSWRFCMPLTLIWDWGGECCRATDWREHSPSLWNSWEARLTNSTVG